MFPRAWMIRGQDGPSLHVRGYQIQEILEHKRPKIANNSSGHENIKITEKTKYKLYVLQKA